MNKICVQAHFFKRNSLRFLQNKKYLTGIFIKGTQFRAHTLRAFSALGLFMCQVVSKMATVFMAERLVGLGPDPLLSPHYRYATLNRTTKAVGWQGGRFIDSLYLKSQISSISNLENCRLNNFTDSKYLKSKRKWHRTSQYFLILMQPTRFKKALIVMSYEISLLYDSVKPTTVQCVLVVLDIHLQQYLYL